MPWYRLSVCAAAPSVTLDAGFGMQVPQGLAALRPARTVIVAPTGQPERVPAEVLAALRAARRRGCRILSLCTGAFILAAARAAMSPRTFARRFLASTGTTPYQWIVRERVRLAQRLLETSDLPVEAIARSSGFCTAGNLRKHFARALRTSPQSYRRAFRS